MANGSSSYPYSVNVPRNTRFLFSNKTSTPSKAIAKSIVRSSILILSLLVLNSESNIFILIIPDCVLLLYLLKVYLLRPGSSAQEHFDKLINILEQCVPSCFTLACCI